MKKYGILFLSILLISFSCSDKAETIKLEPGTLEYMLAKDLAAVVPSVDPDSNIVLVSTKYFDVTTGEIIQVIYTSFGSRSAELAKMDANRIKSILQMNADKLAEQKLVLHAASEKGISISEAELDSMLQEQYKRVGGEEAFKRQLESNGITIEFVRKDITNAYMAQKYMDQVFADADLISDKEIDERYRQLLQQDRTASVQHILMMTQGKAEAQKAEIYKKMKKILNRARQGEDFGELAQQYSEDPGSKDRGGLYEDFARGTMVKPFEEAAFKVPVGELSDIIETRYGYHILKVVDRKQETRTLDEMRDELKEEITKNKEGQFINEHMDTLKSEADYTLTTL